MRPLLSAVLILSLTACNQPKASASKTTPNGAVSKTEGTLDSKSRSSVRPSNGTGKASPKATKEASPDAETDSCADYSYETLSGPSLPKEIEEMSGLVVSSMDGGSLFHIADSGNEPLIVQTKRDGTLIGSYRYSETTTDTEELSEGECPWGGSCLYVYDIGDNAYSRKSRSIFAVDMKTLKSGKPKVESFQYTYPDGKQFDVEAVALANDTFYFFEKNKGKSRVYSLTLDALKEGSSEAEYVTELPYTKITGASASKDGKRIVLVGYAGAYELSMDDNKGKKSADEWYPYRRTLSVEMLAQQEAVSYDLDDRSFLYTSEKSDFSDNKKWGIMKAKCDR